MNSQPQRHTRKPTHILGSTGSSSVQPVPSSSLSHSKQCSKPLSQNNVVTNVKTVKQHKNSNPLKSTKTPVNVHKQVVNNVCSPKTASTGS